MDIVVMPGDGIGPEITAATLKVLQAANQAFGLDMTFQEVEDGTAVINQKRLGQHRRPGSFGWRGMTSTTSFCDLTRSKRFTVGELPHDCARRMRFERVMHVCMHTRSSSICDP